MYHLWSLEGMGPKIILAYFSINAKLLSFLTILGQLKNLIYVTNVACDIVVYMCFIFYSMQHFTSCVQLKKSGLVILYCYFSGRMETISMWETGKQKLHSVLNEQLLVIESPSNCLTSPHIVLPFTDIIPVDQKYDACCKNKVHVYYWQSWKEMFKSTNQK